MPKLYYSVLTSYGSQAFARAMASRQPLNITTFAVGDGNGRAVQPDSQRTSLVREVYRANVSAISLDPRNARQVIFELTIPENVGGFWIREMGIFDNQNRLVAYANCPDSFKPQLESGSGKVQVLRMILLVSSSDAVTLTVDDSVIFAKRGELTPQTITATSQNSVDQTGHSHAIDHASTSRKGVVQLTNDTGLDSESLALTAKGAKKLSQEIAQNRINTTNLANQKVDKSAISDSVSSSSQTSVASSKAVKTAYDQANTKVPIDGDCEMTGTKSFFYQIRIKSNERGSDKYLRFGQNEVDSFFQNPYSGKYLQLRNNGRLQYDSRDVFVKGLQNPHWDDIEGKPNASTSQRGLAQYTDSVNFDSSDWGASAKGLRTVNLKAEAAQRSANDAMNRANAAHHSERSYVGVTANTAGYGGLNIDRPNRGDLFRMESENNQLKFLRMNRISRAIHYAIYFPERNGEVALIDEVVRKSGDRMTGNLEVPYLKVKRPNAWINLISESHASVGLDFTSWNGKHAQCSLESIDIGNFATEFRFHVTPQGSNYNSDRRQHVATITPIGQMWLKNYGWLHDKFLSITGGQMTGDLEVPYIKVKRPNAWVNLISENHASVGVDFTSWNGRYAQCSLESIDIGNFATEFRFHATPQGQNYNTDRRQHVATISPIGQMWLKDYGWLHDSFMRRSDFIRTWYPQHYAGTEVYKIRHLGLMVTVMNVNGGGRVVNLPEAYDGHAIVLATDRGTGHVSVNSNYIVNNNQVHIGGRSDTIISVLVIGSKNV